MRLLIYAMLVLLLQGCGGFAMNFTGGRLDPTKYKSVAVNSFLSNVPNGPANLGVSLTEKLRDYYQRNTPLALLSDDVSDITLEGAISGYAVAPAAPSGNALQQGGQLQRLTITVQLKYTDNVEESKSFDRPFSFFQDFPADQNLASVESNLVPIIIDQLIIEMFNQTYANW